MTPTTTAVQLASVPHHAGATAVYEWCNPTDRVGACIALLNAACTHLNGAGIRRHIRAALDAGATGEEIRETFKGRTPSRSDSVGIPATADPARVMRL